jgi:hypothetical protein
MSRSTADHIAENCTISGSDSEPAGETVEDGEAVDTGAEDDGDEKEGDAVSVGVGVDVVAVSVGVGVAVSAHADDGANATRKHTPATASQRRSHIRSPPSVTSGSADRPHDPTCR